ncbi:hypothetical protein RD110_08040 [Rhodoferax koreense]|uniref:Portal protein n=1 Tax=Rhodoferax koreensis TaxID=1842727 RepID=A0A1P8JTT0_9BURK|nr:hypothetical protein [Rhodoferax koreense]APW37153.1 hypothetical protein RD110_08040 [Rhodoferax koreense]
MFEQPAPAAPEAADQSPAERVVSEEDKKLAADWLKKIAAAEKRVEKTFKQFDTNRKLLAGKKPNTEGKETVRANLHYANMAAMLPQIYAKDPEFSAQPGPGVNPQQIDATKKFASTCEFMLKKFVVKDANLKKQAKKTIRSGFATSVGWLKASWQEKRGQDPLILNQIKDTQDNIDRIQMLLDQANDPQAGSDEVLKLAELKQTMEGLQSQTEIAIAKGIALDFVMSEDILVVDPSVRAVADYPRAAAMAHRVWMTPDQYQTTFGYACKKGKSYSEQEDGGAMKAGNGGVDNSATLLCVWEIWCQDDNRLYYVCDGEEGFCKPPSSVDWTGKRWYPFFLLTFNEIDGSFYPLSDIELTDKLVSEHNQSRDDFVRDRREALPVLIVRKGGSLTPADVENIKNRKGGDTIMVEGVGGQPITNDVWMGQMAQLKGENYDTSGARGDMEKILGGGDTSTGSITKAKTATEAEILSQGLRSRAGERQDILEDLLNELGPYCLEIMLRKFNEAEVRALAGEDAVWPQMGIDQIFNLISVEVRGGSTGKPDRLQEQDRWTKLLPIINEAVSKVAELREKGQDNLAQAVIELTRETMRRFDERIDIEQFLPKQAEGQDDPAAMKQQLIMGKQQLDALEAELKDANEKLEKGLVSAGASIATSADPIRGAIAFQAVMGNIAPGVLESLPPMPEAQEPGEHPTNEPSEPGEPGAQPVPQPQTAEMPQ